MEGVKLNAESPAGLIRRLTRLQVIIGIVTASIVSFFNYKYGIGVLIGVLFGVLLSWYFAVKFLSVNARENPAVALKAFYRAAVMKWLLAIVLFGLAAKFLTTIFWSIAIGYFLTAIAYRFLLLNSKT